MSQMKLVHPRSMSEREMRAYRFCLASSPAGAPRDEMAAVIIENLPFIEDSVRVVKRPFQMPGLGTADALACDADGRAGIIDVCDRLDAGGICRSCQRMDWMEGNAVIVAYLCPQFRAGSGLRCWHLARDVSAGADSLLNRVESGAPEIFEFGCLSLAGEKWLVVQRREEFKKSQGIIRERETKPVSHPRTLLTAEEIDEFMSDAGDDEITSRCSL